MQLPASTVLALVALTGICKAQVIDPNSVSLNMRENWCTIQKSSCPLLCTQIGGTTEPESNDCEPETLQYACVCSNGLQPNASEYSQTIPFYECTESNNQCEANCGSDSACASNCRTRNPCGAQDPPPVNLTTTTSTATATSTSTSDSTEDSNNSDGDDNDYSGFNSPAESSSAAHALAVDTLMGSGELVGLTMLSISLFAGATLLL